MSLGQTIRRVHPATGLERLSTARSSALYWRRRQSRYRDRRRIGRDRPHRRRTVDVPRRSCGSRRHRRAKAA